MKTGLVLALLLASFSAAGASAPALCSLPLKDYCSGGRCPAYADWLQQAKQGVEGAGCALTLEVGICDDLRYIRTRHRSGGTTAYFNADDRVVAANQVTGAGRCLQMFYGPQPLCLKRSRQTFRCAR